MICRSKGLLNHLMLWLYRKTVVLCGFANLSERDGILCLGGLHDPRLVSSSNPDVLQIGNCLTDIGK